MRRLFVLALALTLSAALSPLHGTLGHAQAQTTQEWTKVSSEGGRFSILMPAKPNESEQKVDAETGPLTNHVFMAVLPSGPAYAISYADNPRMNPDVQQLLNGVRDGAVKGVKGKLLTTTDITHKGYPGREFQASIQAPLGEGLYTSRIYIVGTRLYQIVVVGFRDKISSADINKFLTSFDLKTDGGR